MFTVIISVLATAVAMLVGISLCMRLDKRRKGIVIEALMKQLSDKPQRTFKNGKREYLVAFVKGRELGTESYLIPIQSQWEKMSNMSDYEKQFRWGIFCDVDVRTIERFIECNPAIAVLNIPTESPDYRTTNSMYKIIRVK